MTGIITRLFGFWLFAFLASPGHAQTAPDAPQLPPESDVRVIVDISGSMKKNDPENLRQPAVRLLARMLPEGTEAGIWTFGQYVNMLVPHAEVDDTWRQLAIARSSQINSVALRTNLGQALEVASDPYFSDGDLSNTHFILLTDGKVDIAANDEAANERERQRILTEQLTRLRDLGATIHTVALSAEADLDLLTRLATATDGSRSIADTADELNRVFLRALNTAVPQAQVPIEDSGFTVDAGVEEFTALIFPGEGVNTQANPLTLKDPSGTTLSPESDRDNLRWVRESGYDLITVQNPAAGRWTLDGELGEGSRVTVVSDLKMVTGELPARFYHGQSVEVTAAFYEDDTLITDPDFLGVIEVSLTLTTEDGRSGTKVLSPEQPPEDGVYRDVIQRLQEPGDYQLTLLADGQTFSRKFTRVLTLRPPVSVVVNAQGSADATRYQVAVEPEHPNLDVANSEVLMQVAMTGQTSKPVPLAFDPQRGAWVGVVEASAGDGEYAVRLAFDGITTDGTELAYRPESFSAVFPRAAGEQNVRIPLAAASVEEPAPQPEPAVEPEPEPTPESAEPAAEPPMEAPVGDSGPIDLSQLESPEPAAEPDAAPAATAEPEEPAAGLPWVWLAGGGAALVALLAAGFWFWRRKKANADAESEVTGEAGQGEEEDVPLVADPEPEAEPEPEPDEPEPEMAAELDTEPMAELEDEVPVATPEPTDEIPPEELEDIPELTDSQAGDEAEPEQKEQPVAEEPDKNKADADEDDIFGMEEFDLSDIEDLPDVTKASDEDSDRKK